MEHELANIEEFNEELNEEFRIYLKEIQPYVSKLKLTEYELQSCQKWLHKLLKIDRRDKILRNDYLAQLIKQLKNGQLNEPFNKVPQDNESLLPLTTYISMDNGITPIYKECGDGFTLSYETKIKLESIENMYEELKIKNELLVNQVQLYAYRKNLSNNRIIAINFDLDEVKNKIKIMCDRISYLSKPKVTEKSEDLKNCKNIIGKTYTAIDNRIDEVLLEVKSMKSTIEIARDNEKNTNCLDEFLEYMKNHCTYIRESRQNFLNKTTQLENTIEELDEYANIKSTEVVQLEEIIDNQNLTIDSYKISIKRAEEYFIDNNILIN